MSAIELFGMPPVVFTLLANGFQMTLHAPGRFADMSQAERVEACYQKSVAPISKKKMPASPPTLNEIVRLIDQVGCFLGRKSDAEPGVQTIWGGLNQVHATADTLHLLHDGLG